MVTLLSCIAEDSYFNLQWSIVSSKLFSLRLAFCFCLFSLLLSSVSSLPSSPLWLTNILLLVDMPAQFLSHLPLLCKVLMDTWMVLQPTHTPSFQEQYVALTFVELCVLTEIRKSIFRRCDNLTQSNLTIISRYLT